ncbi:MAG: UDPGP type 1 family protein [Phycisphaerales bacterium]|nr:UDPGP type 1 family protein [Phycisphaerales bacterium]
MPAPTNVLERLKIAGQEHLVRFWDELGEAEQAALAAQIASIDVAALPRLVEEYVHRKPAFELPRDVEPAPYYPASGRGWDRARFRAAGEGMLRAGQVAAFTVAGGQGSRLGFDGPKGCYPAGAVTGRTLFQFFAEGLLAAGRKYGRPVPWYVMTSPQNHAATLEYFEGNRWLGLDREQVMFFPQGVMPTLDMASGRVLLAGKGEVATNPDGHGGSIRALHESGALADMQRRGVRQISYFQVDNPTVRVVDPVFLGLHAGAADSSGEMSSKMVPKIAPEERVGMFCRAGGRVQVIEYSDLPMELQRQRLADGSLRFLAGSIAVHAMSVEFVRRLATDPAFSLPYHRADKKVPHVDPEGLRVDPDGPNGVKLERFVFDALPLCGSSIVLETDRVEEFAPIKNARGPDSPESSAGLQTRRAARWLLAAGAFVPMRGPDDPDCTIELSPLTASEPDDLRGRRLAPIGPGARVVV